MPLPLAPGRFGDDLHLQCGDVARRAGQVPGAVLERLEGVHGHEPVAACCAFYLKPLLEPRLAG